MDAEVEPIQEAKQRLGMQPADPGRSRTTKFAQRLQANYLGVVEEGIRDIDGALEIDGEYDDANASRQP